MEQSESHDPTSEIEVFGEVMPPMNTSRSMLLAMELVLRVARVGEVGAAAGPLELASPSLMTALEPQGASSG